MRNPTSSNLLIILPNIHLFLLLISIPSSQSLYKFSELQQNEIFEKINHFGEWFSITYSKISEKYGGRQKAVTFEDVDFRNDMTLPRKSEIKHISEKLHQYFDALNYGELKKESGARKMLGELSDELDKFSVKMSDWLEAKLREKWRQSDVHRKRKKETVAMAKKETESSSADGHTKDEKRKGKEILEQAESSSSRNIENEEKIGVHFLTVKINEKIYELNEQIWFQNYNPFLRKLKREMQMDQINIWKFYQLTLETRLNGIMEKELNKKILGILPKMWKRDAEKIFNKKIAGIVQKVRNRIDKKRFNEMKKGMEAFLKLDETVMGTKIYEKKKFFKEFFEKLLEWQKGYCKIVNKIKLAELEEIVAKQMDENVEMMARENAEIMKNMDRNVPKVKNIAMDADGSKSTALGRMAKFARNIVNEIEAEIGNKYENEAIKMEIKHLYYTVLTNRATMEMVNFIENEFVWTENFASQRNKAVIHQQSPQHFVPLTEHSEIIQEEIQTVEIGRKKFTIENLANITILVEFFLKNYLDKLNDKIKMWKLVFDFDKRKEKKVQKFGLKKAKLPPKKYEMVEEDNPLVQSIKLLWQSTKNKNGLNLFEYGMRQNELPENFLDRHKIAQQGMNLDVQVIVDSMNLLAIFSRLKHLMEKTEMDKIVRHFKAGKIELEMTDKLRAKIENIHGQKIPRTFAAFIYDKYVENFEPKSIRGGFVPTFRRSPTKRPPSSPSSTETETEFLTPPASPFNPSETGQHGRGDHQNEEDDENGVEFQNDHRENDHQIPESMKAHWDLILEGADLDQEQPDESSNKGEPFSDTFVQPADVNPRK